jgi:crotonobetainyl-CoA:carnitine CoA-transferase CaiB-like acyl-CoA transferase
MAPVPRLASHTEAILAELGCSAERIAGLRDRGVA